MPRTRRNAPGGTLFHVLNRAVARIKIFKNDKDCLAFERTLLDAHARLPIPILAYCIMPNHFHLVLWPQRDGDLSRFMTWLTLTHVQRWRAFHNTIGFGPLYQGRFKAFPIEADEHLLTVLRYVERNPLRANLVERAQDWRWSSLHRRTVGTSEDRLLLSPWPIDIPDDWLKRVNTPQSPAEEEALQLAILRSRPFGSPTWQHDTAKRLNLESSLRPEGRPPGKKQST